MECLVGAPFTLLQIPNMRLKRPSWLHAPSAMRVFTFVLAAYFLITGGVVYDVINEPPSIGSTTDERGHSRPVAFLAYRVNGQYIMEGLAAAFMFVLGAVGFIVLDGTHNPSTPRGNRAILIGIGVTCVLISYACCFIFMRIKLPYYLR